MRLAVKLEKIFFQGNKRLAWGIYTFVGSALAPGCSGRLALSQCGGK
jgi:Uri superfamily endonuclease